MHDVEQDNASAATWKRKYYDNLESLEHKEKQWTQAEDLLRRTISRLTLAADGLDATLDQQLNALRNAIRDRVDNASLRPRIEAMSETLVRLDRKRQAQPGAPAPVQLLEQVLEQLSLPRGTARQLKALRKQIHRAQADTPVEEMATAFAALLNKALELVEPADTPTPTRGGLLGRLLGGKADEAVEDGASSQASPAERAADTGLGPARALLLHMLDRIKDTHASADLRKAAVRAGSEAELQSLADSLWPLLAEPAPAPPAAVDEVLLQLLQRLDLPAELDESVAQLKERLGTDNDGADWQQRLGEVADLVGRMRSRIQQEKRELEDFLVQLTERLQEVDRHIHGAEDMRRVSRDHGRELGAAVQEQVRHIGISVQDAADLTQLKIDVQSRLDNILSHVTEHQQAEDDRQRQAEQRLDELTERLQAMESETDALRERVREERRQALTDSLTGIPNRLAWEERLEQEYARWKRFDEPLHILVWDIDKFKQINDEYGHKAGDRVLTTIAELLSGQIRETDFIARYGGEEFVMLATGAEPEDVTALCEKLRQSVETCGFHFRGSQVPVTISCGISQFNEDDSPERVFERADRALYMAKDKGRNRCERLDT